MASRTLATSLLLGLVAAQQIGTTVPEVHPKLTTWKCTKAGGCVAQNTSLVIDSVYRKLNKIGTTQSCLINGNLDPALCPDETTCSKNCALEGVDYAAQGIVTKEDAVTMKMYVDGNGVSPRAYLLNSDGKNYENVKLLGQELSFDVDVSNLPCGMNGALYLGEMKMDGGRSDLNPAGATMGTGYCDAQCPKLAFIDGHVSNLVSFNLELSNSQRPTLTTAAPAATKMIFGRPMRGQPYTHLTRAASREFTLASMRSAAALECATSLAAATIRTRRA